MTGRLPKELRRLLSLLPGPADLRTARRSPGRDLVAGLTVAVVALPLALAFGVASGLGAEAGLTTAVIAGIIAAVFGGSNLQISGPTGAMTVVLLPVVHDFGTQGVLLVGVMAGVVLVALAVSGIGKAVRLLPTSLVEGFTAGIAVVIVLQQVPAMLGLDPGEGEQVWAIAGDAVARWTSDIDVAPLLMTLGVAAVILTGTRLLPTVPASILVIIVATVLAEFLGLGLPTIGEIPAGIPAPTSSFIDLAAVPALFPSALAVAALAALESLLCATVADSMSVSERHDPDRELLGQGLANIVVPFFGGVPATAAIARTAVNVRAGARSRVAAITHSLVLLVVIYAASDLVGHIPLAALAGVLLATCLQMVGVGSLSALVRSTRADAIVLFLTFAITVAVDLVTAVVVGVIVAALLALGSVSRSARLEQVPLDEDRGDHSVEELALLADRIVAYRFEGPLFFGAAHRFLLELTEVSDVDVVILRMSRISTLDATGATIVDDAVRRLEARGIAVLISGVHPVHSRVLRTLNVAPHLRQAGRVFENTPQAITYARGLVASH
ncbi:SulP family inorganic anion transporter [Salinibacterium sp. SYSU T00001]|uniref:SulP family inorganic anion transporter n=1 Tax=Homoserinimonas sedimenticola TaxID=2986805 RepID=UPI002236AF53|nr:SulP family inorganic anion transporter [Salinibacterium sedimenticola]MCW4386758.1 SulP family inorganic anion transporter [Salinibacterium sedimenticola]